VYCPNCGAEYRPGFTVCTDCHVALVPDAPEGIDYEGLTPEERRDKSILDVDDYQRVEPVCVHIADAIIDAEIVLAALKANGIRAFTAGSGLELYTGAGAIGQMTRAPGPLNSMRILVHPEDEEAALEIIAEAESHEVDVDPSEYAPLERPPLRLDRERRKRIGRIVAVLLLSAFLSGIVFQAIELISRLLSEF
jgi:Putative prokaryotic signal transducing protein